MAVDALLRVGGESIILSVGALEAGAIAAQAPVLLSWHPATGLQAYVVVALAGTHGHVFGALIAWEIGRPRGARWSSATAAACTSRRRISGRAEAGSSSWGDRAVFVG
jgi:hypothetical protein